MNKPAANPEKNFRKKHNKGKPISKPLLVIYGILSVCALTVLFLMF